MKILYITDLHGITWKYERILHEAKSLNVDMVINGGDMLTFKGNLLHQDKFITGFLDGYFSNFESSELYYACQLGNDDCIIFDDLFQETCNKYSYVINLAQKRFQIKDHGYEFIGMNWVTDLPFGLKDRARTDNRDFKLPKQIGKQYISNPNGWRKIEDWASYIKSLPTLEDELNQLVKPNNMKKTIYIFHMPPSKIGLDVCHDGREVGSIAIYEFLMRTQPLLSFHGHIHESPKVSGIWKSSIGKTICIQPGQSHQHENYLDYVVIDIETMDFKKSKLIKED
ncbi:MAG: metallophosphoesterase [Candidatus Hodarchaeota archaeon]